MTFGKDTNPITFGFLGKKHTTYTKEKISEKKKGKCLEPFTEEHKNNMSKSRLKRKERLGYINSPKTREKMKKPKSEQHKINLSLAKTGENIFTEFRIIKKQRIRHSKEYIKWREKVFERDNYTCQKKDCSYCNNEKGVYLHPHHIITMGECLNLCCEEEIYNLNNGITYCKDFHLKSGLHKR